MDVDSAIRVGIKREWKEEGEQMFWAMAIARHYTESQLNGQ